jgi:phosphomannomutase
VSAEQSSPDDDRYFCPGQRHPVSRAVHLGRLAAFYPPCRQCLRRDDTGTLSPRRVAQLAETAQRGQPRSLFHDEGAGGVYLNDLTPAATKSLAAAFGGLLLEKARLQEAAKPQAVLESRTSESEISSFKSPSLQISKSPDPQISKSPNLQILLAGDARPLTAELVAAAAEGLRSIGCDVVDLGPSTAACLAFAVARLEAAGGLLIGNPGSDSHSVGIKFWRAGANPLSAGGSLEPIIERYCGGPQPTARKYGELHRCRADEMYLAEMSKLYHALRPLRVVVDSASKPAADLLQRLAATVACNVIPSRSTRSDLPQQIRSDAAHFAACIDGDGETCLVFDEQGRDVPPERLLLLLAAQRSRTPPDSPVAARQPPAVSLSQPATVPPGSVILETGTSPSLVDLLTQRGVHVVTCSPRRAEMAAAMRANAAMLGGGASGRLWHADFGLPLCDALMTVTQLLRALSRSDAPLSRLLDRDARLS